MAMSIQEGQKRIMVSTLFATYGDKAYGTKAAAEIIFVRAKKTVQCMSKIKTIMTKIIVTR
jgi:hypothetical protein